MKAPAAAAKASRIQSGLPVEALSAAAPTMTVSLGTGGNTPSSVANANTIA